MCGISGIVGENWTRAQLDAMIGAQTHRGPDDTGVYVEPGIIGLGHNRLSIIDLETGHQPMESADGNLVIVYNGEIYNYVELVRELSDYPFQTASDTEVILAAYQKWGAACLNKFIGMFAIAIWNKAERSLFLARDRFGVKPLYYAYKDGCIYFASEIKALFAAGISKDFDEDIWADYLVSGVYGGGEWTFYRHITQILAGSYTRLGAKTITLPKVWYPLRTYASAPDTRPMPVVKDEYLSLMRDAVRLRFRSDVPVGVNLSGGLDSSVLLALVDELYPDIPAFTFRTGTEYDEAKYIEPYIGNHPWLNVRLYTHEFDAGLADDIQYYQDEPYGGIPTVAYAALFDQANHDGMKVLLDGNGMDEQWAGYDYYGKSKAIIQGGKDRATRPECLLPKFRELADDITPPDGILNRQIWDITAAKLPKALRFNDRISMGASVELRSPFMDHRLIELALRQPDDRKIRGGVHKWLLREIAKDILPEGVVHAPKRPVQTPQREWLRGELRPWAEKMIGRAMDAYAGKWFDPVAVYREWDAFCNGRYDNSFFVWQWVSLGMMAE